MSQRWSAHELIDLVLDPGSYESWDEPIDISGHSAGYQDELRAAAERAGTDESVITGRGLVRGRPVAFVVNEFSFLGGSIGIASGERIVACVRRATAEGLPLLATTASGGTRMQEGTPAFVEMVAISRAVMAHRAAGLPYLVHLRHPTTGGVYASWGSLGHVTVAEPGALVGFLGPKVYEALEGRPFPEGVQRAENLAEKGVIDAVVSTEDLPVLIDKTLAVLVDPPVEPALPVRSDQSWSSRPVWESVELTRSESRLGVRDVLRYGAAGTLALNGTEEGEQDAAVLVTLTRLDGQPCVLVGQDRVRQTPEKPLGAAALREARRGMRLAEELGLPLVTIIDTPGAELSPAAEEGAIAGEIARCIATLTTMTRADGVGDPRPGHRRRSTRAAPGAGRHRRPERLALAAASRGRERHPPRRPRPRRRDGRGPGHRCRRPAGERHRAPRRTRAPRRRPRVPRHRRRRPGRPGAAAG